jgi:hypothetical protein
VQISKERAERLGSMPTARNDSGRMSIGTLRQPFLGCTVIHPALKRAINKERAMHRHGLVQQHAPIRITLQTRYNCCKGGANPDKHCRVVQQAPWQLSVSQEVSART